MSANVSRAVLVVGAGVAGLAAACGLQRQGYQVTVVERNAAPEEPAGELQARVSAFSPASIRFLASLGAWPAGSDRIRPYGNMWVWTDGDFDHVHFSAAEMGKSELGAIAENGLIQHALYVAALKAGVQFEFEAEWSDLDNQANAVALSLQDGRRLEAGWLVVAEGAQSKLREALGVASRGWRYEQQALVCSIQWGDKTDANKPDIDSTAWQRFLKTGPLALLPLATGESSLVWSLEHEACNRLKQLDDSDFVCELNSALAGVAPNTAVSVGKRFGFPLRLSQAESYRAGRCFLIGDSAHGIHPLAGQGLNLGVMDARDLVSAFEKGADESALSAWQRKRKAKAAEMMALTDGLYRAYRVGRLPGDSHSGSFFGKARGNAFRALLSAGMSVAGGSALLRQELARAALGSD